MNLLAFQFIISICFPDSLSSNDTLVFNHFELGLLYSSPRENSSGNYLIEGKLFSKNELDSIQKNLTKKTDLLGGQTNKYWCILLDSRKNKTEEGFWTLECFWGPYIKYHKNGKIAAIGEYSNPFESYYCLKINSWKYYSKRGKLRLIENYDNKGILISKQKFR